MFAKRQINMKNMFLNKRQSHVVVVEVATLLQSVSSNPKQQLSDIKVAKTAWRDA